MEGGKKIRSVDKAMALLELLGESRSPLTLSELERRSGVPKSTIHGLLSTMREHHMVSQQADGRYCLGLRLFELGCAVSASWDVTGVAAPYLAKLSSVTGATAFLAVRSGGEAVTLDQSREGSGLRIVSETGCRLPLYCTSQGKLFLAWCSSEGEQARLLRAHPPVPHTPHTITDPERLVQELGSARSAPRATPWRTGSSASACGRCPPPSSAWAAPSSTPWEWWGSSGAPPPRSLPWPSAWPPSTPPRSPASWPNCPDIHKEPPPGTS